MHSELKDISLWDDDTPVNEDEVSIPFLREVELAAGSGKIRHRGKRESKPAFWKAQLAA